jgi:hypothetical protein
VVKVLKDTFRQIVFQKETIRGWQRRWGSRVQGTALAAILEQLKTLPTAQMVDRFLPTSRECCCCGYRNAELTLRDS